MSNTMTGTINLNFKNNKQKNIINTNINNNIILNDSNWKTSASGFIEKNISNNKLLNNKSKDISNKSLYNQNNLNNKAKLQTNERAVTGSVNNSSTSIKCLIKNNSKSKIICLKNSFKNNAKGEKVLNKDKIILRSSSKPMRR